MEWNENHTRIKKALKENNKLVREFIQTNKETDWNIYDSWLESYARTFRESLPQSWIEKSEDYLSSSTIFKKYITETLRTSENKNNLTAVEFGGPGSNLFASMDEKLFKATAGVCLSDIRTENQAKEDTKRKHKVIIGDIMNTSDEELNEVKKNLGTNKVDLIISRMAGPLNHINMNPAILDRIFRNWYKMLAPNGLMFIQFVYSSDLSELSLSIKNWADILMSKFPELEIQVSKTCLRFHKKEGSPETLPSVTQLFKDEGRSE
jgi:hypothetical protein